MFNWEKFKNGEIAVQCDTEEKAKDFLKKCDENNIFWGRERKASSQNYWNKYKEDTAYSCMHSYAELGYSEYQFYKRRIEIVKWGDKMEKSFREVIADIKEGEVWVQTNDFCVTGKISCINKEIIIDLKQARSSFGTLGKYKLQRKEYTFQEAFKAYEEGKEIENCEECRFKLIDKDKTLIIDCAGDEMEYSNKTELFSVKEIRGKWYIND